MIQTKLYVVVIILIAVIGCVAWKINSRRKSKII